MKKQNKYDSVNLVRIGQEKKETLSAEPAVKKITNLYKAVSENMQDSLEKLSEIGKLLTEQKENTEHGKFTEWVEKNLPFGIRQAQKYMRLFENGNLLINANSNSLLEINSLEDSLKLISNPKGKSDSYNESKEHTEKANKKESGRDRISELKAEIKDLKAKLKKAESELARLEKK